MQVKVLSQTTSWRDAYYSAVSTQKEIDYNTFDEPSDEMKFRMLYSRHSPAKMVRYLFKVTIPNKTQNHLVRHNIGVLWFVQTLRNDLTGIDGLTVHRETPRSVVFEINAVAIFHIYSVRICQKAEKETQQFAELMRKALIEFEPIFRIESLWPNPCSDCREIAFKPCSKRKRLTTEAINKLLNK